MTLREGITRDREEKRLVVEHYLHNSCTQLMGTGETRYEFFGMYRRLAPDMPTVRCRACVHGYFVLAQGRTTGPLGCCQAILQPL